MNLSAPIQFNSKPKKLDVLLFTKHLSTMLKAGIPVVDALATLSEQTNSVGFKKVINGVLADTENGQSLSKSLAKYPHVFDQFYVSLIEVSEKSGSLEENLNFITLQLGKSYNLKKKIQAAMLYPMIVFVALTIMGGFISLFVLPQLVGFFEALDVTLPLSTRILLFIANLFKNYGLIIISGFVVGFILLGYLLRTKAVRPKWDAFILHLPILGNFFITSQLASFARNLGVLIKSGVPAAQGLEITASTLANMKYRADLLKVSQLLAKGKSIAKALKENKFFGFPALVIKMIEVGEKTGKLDESLLYLGDFYEEEIDNFSKNLTTILEPVLLIFVGLIVGFVGLAIITPIYELSGSIR